jgi:signal transduction histidine kinase
VSETSADPLHQRLIDPLVAIAMALTVALVVAAGRSDTGPSSAGAYVFAVGFGVLALGGRRWPRAALVLTVLGVFGYYIFQFPPIGIALPAVAALYRAAERGRTGWAIGAGAVLVSVAAYFRVTEGLSPSYLGSYELLTNVALVAAAITLGVSVRARRETRIHQERLRALTLAEQAKEAERRVQAERVRLAQDLHDSVGHAISVIALHSNVAAEAVGRDDGVVRKAVEQIHAAASAQLRELRATVKILRSPEAGAERGAVGLAGLGGLVDNARQAGVAVDLDVDVPADSLDAAIEAAAYRIVQESLTNVLRHSAATHASVTAGIRDDHLEVVVADDGGGVDRAPSRPAGVGAGQGVLGMRERATMLGGRLSAGPGKGGGFVVHAVLPRRLPE